MTTTRLALIEGEGLWRIRRIPGFSSRHSARWSGSERLAFQRHDIRNWDDPFERLASSSSERALRDCRIP